MCISNRNILYSFLDNAYIKRIVQLMNSHRNAYENKLLISNWSVFDIVVLCLCTYIGYGTICIDR